MWNVSYRELWSKLRTQEVAIRQPGSPNAGKWLMDEGLMAKERSCPMCAGEMSLTRCEDRSDGFEVGMQKTS